MPQRCKGPSEWTALCISTAAESPSSASARVPERGRPPDAGQASLWGRDLRLALGYLHPFPAGPTREGGKQPTRTGLSRPGRRAAR